MSVVWQPIASRFQSDRANTGSPAAQKTQDTARNHGRHKDGNTAREMRPRSRRLVKSMLANKSTHLGNHGTFTHHPTYPPCIRCPWHPEAQKEVYDGKDRGREEAEERRSENENGPFLAVSNDAASFADLVSLGWLGTEASSQGFYRVERHAPTRRRRLTLFLENLGIPSEHFIILKRIYRETRWMQYSLISVHNHVYHHGALGCFLQSILCDTLNWLKRLMV